MLILQGEMDMIRNVILDMGNVLLDYDPQAPLDHYCDSREEKETIRRELFEGPEWILADRGEVRADELYGRVRDRVPEAYREHLRQCCEGWHTCMGWLDGAREFCHFIKEAGYRIFILSNAADSFYTYFPSFLPLNFFDGIVVSADVRMIKPDPGIYRYLLERYGLKAEECLFVDDVQANVNGAAAVGMQAFRFTGDYEKIKSEYTL